jgi:hypothetical protein
MRWSYLSQRYLVTAFIVLSILLLLQLYLLWWIAVGIILVVLFFYRKKNYLGEIEDPSLTNSFFTPISGTVKEVGRWKRGASVRIKCAWYQRGDIVMPIHAEVQRYQKQPIDILFATPKNNHFHLEIRPNPLTRRLPFYLWPGDRARRLANIGFLLLGGEILIKFDENYTIIVEKHQRVVAGKVPIAML